VFVAWRIVAGVVLAVLIWRGVLPARQGQAEPPATAQLR
jgi:hypothetical protein